MLARVVFTRRAAVLAASATGRHLRLPQSAFNTRQVRLVPVARPLPQLQAFARFYSTQPQQKNTEGESKEEEAKEEKEENKENKEETEEGKEKENEDKKEDDTPIVEPAWRTSRAGTFQKQQSAQNEVKVSEAYTYLFYALALGGFGLAVWEGYKAVAFAQKESSADPSLVYRRVLDDSIKAITANQRVIDRFAKVQSIIEDSLVQCQAFGKVTSISFPLLQPTTAARVGTVYIDIERVEDTFYLKSAYVDFVFGKTFDLVEAGIIKPSDYQFYLFSREFSMEESMKQMYEATQQVATQAQQEQQQQQRR